MAVRLLVTKSSSPSLPDVYVFDHDRISIGRDSASHLVLPDPRRVVSKQHAEILSQGGAHQLLDLGSKNFTYLNDARLQPGKPYALQKGDLLRIGEYEIAFEPVVEEAYDYDRTVFDASFVNPFEEDAVQLVRALASIQAKYARETPARRTDALREALEQAGEIDGTHEVNAILGRFIGVHSHSSQDALMEGAVPSTRAMAVDARANDLSATPSAKGMEPVHTTEGEDSITDMLAGALSKVIGIPWQFRHEFIGQTIAQSSESPMYYSGNPEALQTFMFDASISEEERDRRLGLVERWIDDLVLHQLALLDGYKASVLQGVERLLQELDPEATELSVRQEGAKYKILPILRRAQVTIRLLEKKRELQREDWSYAERTVFRPAFIKSYLARMTSQRR
jgi:hypothetical protein